jgi:hypothetical protein
MPSPHKDQISLLFINVPPESFGIHPVRTFCSKSSEKFQGLSESGDKKQLAGKASTLFTGRG